MYSEIHHIITFPTESYMVFIYCLLTEILLPPALTFPISFSPLINSLNFHHILKHVLDHLSLQWNFTSSSNFATLGRCSSSHLWIKLIDPFTGTTGFSFLMEMTIKLHSILNIIIPGIFPIPSWHGVFVMLAMKTLCSTNAQ